MTSIATTTLGRTNLAAALRDRRHALGLSHLSINSASNQTLSKAFIVGLERALLDAPDEAALIELDRVLWWTDGTSATVLSGQDFVAPTDVNDLPADRHAPSGPDRARSCRVGQAVRDRRRALRVKEWEIAQRTGLTGSQVQAFESGQVVDEATLNFFDSILDWDRGTVRSIWNGGAVPDITEGTLEGEGQRRKPEGRPVTVNATASWASPERLRAAASVLDVSVAVVLLAVADALDVN